MLSDYFKQITDTTLSNCAATAHLQLNTYIILLLLLLLYFMSHIRAEIMKFINKKSC